MLKQIHSTSFDVTDSIRSHINQNLEKIEKQQDKITRVDVFLKKDKFKYIVEYALAVPHKASIVISVSHEDMYHAVTSVTSKALIKLKKVREKVSKGRHQRTVQTDVE